MKDTSDRLIFALLIMLLIFGALSFFVTPAYEKGVWLIVGALVSGLSGLFGFKFGVHVVKPENNPPN
jgi:hypothetical protein